MLKQVGWPSKEIRWRNDLSGDGGGNGGDGGGRSDGWWLSGSHVSPIFLPYTYVYAKKYFMIL